MISCSINSAELCTPLKDVTVTIRDKSGNFTSKFVTRRDGRWGSDCLEPNTIVHFLKEGFVPKQYTVEQLPEKVRLLEDKLIGYQEKLWYIPGEQVKIYVYSSKEFKAKLYRHGYIKELILDLGKFPPQKQQVPDGHFVQNGLHWNITSIYQIPKWAKPGIYSLLLQSRGEEDFAIPLVVSTPPKRYEKNSEILVLASTNTWQSYNIWGGRSRYRNFEDNVSDEYTKLNSKFRNFQRQLRKKVISDEKWKSFLDKVGIKRKENLWKFKRLSIKRPFTNCNLESSDPLKPFTNHLASGEWRLLAWLEREAYEYDIISGYELHSNPDILKNYKCVILNTHCEYWTRAMYEGLQDFHKKRKGWILNISGNSIFREIEFYEDGSTRCISLSFKDSCADEADILGVRFSMSDYNTCAPYKIVDSLHWAFQKVPFSKSMTFGRLSLNQNTVKLGSRYDPGRPGVNKPLKGLGASGWETDKLCKPESMGFKVIAKGMNRNGGADMVLREPMGKRGGMFSASSVLFSGSLLIDEVASMIVKNIFRVLLEN